MSWVKIFSVLAEAVTAAYPLHTKKNSLRDSMKNIIVDSGPLIALFDYDDKYHNKVVNFLKTYDGNLLTTWAVITEVSHMLTFNLKVQINFLKWVELGGVKLIDLDQKDLQKLIKYMEKYLDVPMDLADGSLMIVAENHHIKEILSIDSDYDIYRTLKKKSLTNVLR